MTVNLFSYTNNKYDGKSVADIASPEYTKFLQLLDDTCKIPCKQKDLSCINKTIKIGSQTFRYDVQGKLAEVVRYDDNNKIKSVRVFDYDNNGKLAVDEIISFNPDGSKKEKVTFANGNVSRKIYEAGEENYKFVLYDKQNREIMRTNADNNERKMELYKYIGLQTTPVAVARYNTLNGGTNFKYEHFNDDGTVIATGMTNEKNVASLLQKHVDING